MPDLSILIPARNEMFLSRTVQDIFEHAEGDTEVIVVLDGAPDDPPLPEHPRLRVVQLGESIGQRAATNLACRLSEARYVMKLDAHCALDQGFDVKLLADMQDDWTMTPAMRNLHAFDWVCPNGHRRYQSPSGPCRECGEPTQMEVVWIAKHNPQSTAMRFDQDLHFQYWPQYKRKQRGDLVETMSLVGACWLLTRDRYWKLDICDEAHGSWGQQGTEVACKTWLSGGRLICSKKTWFAHLFRTQGGDFGFPYPLAGSDVEKARAYSRQLWLENSWSQAVHPLSWLIDRFAPVPGWEDHQATGPTRGILYYTDNQLNMRMAKACRETVKAAGLPITSVSLKPTGFGRNIHMKASRSYETMFRQILTGLEAMTEDVVYLAEHDVLYHPSHFQFVPPRRDCFYYDANWWMVRTSDGFAVSYDMSPLAGLVGYREALLAHFRERMERIEAEGFSYHMGFEPFTHRRVPWQTWYDYELFQAEGPNIDLAHGGNLTPKRFSRDKFRRQPKFWHEADIAHIPGWPDLPQIVSRFGEVR